MKLFIFTNGDSYTYGNIGIIAETPEQAVDVGNKEKEKNDIYNREEYLKFNKNRKTYLTKYKDDFNSGIFSIEQPKSYSNYWGISQEFTLSDGYDESDIGIRFSNWENC